MIDVVVVEEKKRWWMQKSEKEGVEGREKNKRVRVKRRVLFCESE